MSLCRNHSSLGVTALGTGLDGLTVSGTGGIGRCCDIIVDTGIHKRLMAAIANVIEVVIYVSLGRNHRGLDIATLGAGLDGLSVGGTGGIGRCCNIVVYTSRNQWLIAAITKVVAVAVDVSQCRNDLLEYCHGLANRAFFPFGKSRFITGCCRTRDGHYRVILDGNNTLNDGNLSAS